MSWECKLNIDTYTNDVVLAILVSPIANTRGACSSCKCPNGPCEEQKAKLIVQQPSPKVSSSQISVSYTEYYFPGGLTVQPTC